MKLGGPAIHPGKILSDELAEIGVMASDLARAIGVPINRVTQILKGQRGITADTALRLGQWFGSGPEIWMDLQKGLRIADSESGTRRRPQGHSSSAGTPGRSATGIVLMGRLG
ncbi:MAG: HigA family addiction module antidote protein [Gammaproteobacteria bacterium]|nr:HigA family addiction module antidote protein [Gammaproteobacteria bacterium]